MEINEDGFLEELLALRRDQTWGELTTNQPPEINALFSSTSWPFDGLDSSTSSSILPNSTSSYDSFNSIEPPPPNTLDYSTFTDFCIHTSSPILQHQHADAAAALFPAYPHAHAHAPSEEGADGGLLDQCKDEPAVSEDVPITAGSFNIGLSNANKMSKSKKIDGQPSKNLMAERRRRKRLNDRLSMLRSVVPKISKMDRTSILGDTIEYLKELRDKINKLQEEMDVGSNHLNFMGFFKDVSPNDVLVRNSPKFEVERREKDTRVEISCAAKPGLLLSTVTTLEALGLELHHCVISSFNDFSLHASCSQDMEQRNMVNLEEIKQALFRNAGYGGRCL